MKQQHILSLSIKKPCHESWDKMADLADGKFCDSCQKKVVDFTELSNSEILQQLSDVNRICGRFKTDQLRQLNHLFLKPEASIFSWKKLSLAAAFLSIVPFIKAQAKVSIKTEQVPFRNKEETFRADTVKTISGTIIDNDKLPVPGTTIRVKGTDINTESDFKGNYKIYIPPGYDTLVFKFIGYETQEIKIDKLSRKPVDIILKIDNTLNSGSVSVIAGGVYVRRSFFHRMWYAIERPIKSIFGH